MFWRIVGLLKPYRGLLATGFACLLLSIPCQMFHPLVWKFIVDDVVGRRKVSLLLPALGLMLAVHLIGAALGAARTWLLGLAGQCFVADLRNRVHAKLLNQSVQYLQDRRSGDLVQRVIGDVDALQEVVINGVDNILGTALSFIWVAAVIVWLNWVVGLLTLVPLVFVAFLVWFFNKRVKEVYRKIRDRLGDLSARINEHLLGSLIIKAFAREAFEERRFREENESYTQEGMKGVAARTYYMPAVMTVGFFSNIIMVGMGAWQVLYGDFTIGGLIAYRGYWWQLYSPVLTLAQINETLQRANASARRVFEILDAPVAVEDVPGATAPEHVTGRLNFKDVTFGYDPARPVLREVTFEAQPGRRTGIVGPSGAGKSTVLGLVLRLYDPQNGTVSLDGHDLRALPQAAFRRHMAIVTQESFLFNDTVRNNILFGKLDASAEEVEAAARSANAHEFIQDLALGYETSVGERGVKLSGGQKQRICIARAFLANPRVLLLDEATASVEAESEALIQAALERLMEGRTTIVVTHRLSLARECDQILVVQDGRITERGSHAELLASGGWYGRMYPLQMEGVDVE